MVDQTPGEFERAGLGDCGREMELATGMARRWDRERAGGRFSRERAQQWRKTRWSAFDARISGDVTP
jgi:hypothetical protein